MRSTTQSIGSYTFDAAARTLLRGGTSTRLPRKAAELLALLAERGGELVSRESIFTTLWPEGFIEDGNLTQTIYLLRKALAADPSVEIENVPRLGYRLRCVAVPAKATRAGMTWSRFAFAAGAFAAVIVVLGAWVAMRAPASGYLSPQARADVDLAMYHFDRIANIDLAQRYFSSTTHDAPSSPEGYAGLALVQALKGFDASDRAAACARGNAALARADAIRVSSLGHVARAMLAVTCERSLTVAQAEVDAALAMDPRSATALGFRSRIGFWRNRPAEAVTFAKEAVAENPTSAEALLDLGIAEYYDRDFQHAVSSFTRLLELMPNHPAARDFLARSYDGLGDFSAAERVVREAELAPASAPWTVPMQARLLAERGQRQRAFDLLRARAVASDPEAVASAYVALGDDARAVAYLLQSGRHRSLTTQIAWLSDFRFADLRARYAGLTGQFVTWKIDG